MPDRYFKTSNASRPYRAGSLIITFEPVLQVGGVWHGVLAVEESAASLLAAEGFPQVKEITAEEYDAAKKKPLARSSTFIESRPPSLRLQVPESPAAPSAQAPDAKLADAAPALAALMTPEVKTARVDPPDELAGLSQVIKPKPGNR